MRAAVPACVELRRDGPAARLSSRRSLIRQVSEVDPLLTPPWGGPRRGIAVIEPACAGTADRRLAVGRPIREQLGLPTAAPSLRAPPAPRDALAADPPRAWSAAPLFEDLPIPDPALA